MLPLNDATCLSITAAYACVEVLLGNINTEDTISGSQLLREFLYLYILDFRCFYLSRDILLLCLYDYPDHSKSDYQKSPTLIISNS